MREIEYEGIAVTIGVAVLFIGISASLVIVNKTSPNCDLNNDNELTIKDLSILAAQINNK